MLQLQEMTASEIRKLYLNTHEKIKYARKRIEHEEEKNAVVTDKVKGSSTEFPYTSKNFTIKGMIGSSEKNIKKWKQEIEQMQEQGMAIEKYIDNIEDVEKRNIWWAYCIENKKQQEIAKELCVSQRTISRILASKVIKSLRSTLKNKKGI